jgi:hypothetical protein
MLDCDKHIFAVSCCIMGMNKRVVSKPDLKVITTHDVVRHDHNLNILPSLLVLEVIRVEHERYTEEFVNSNARSECWNIFAENLAAPYLPLDASAPVIHGSSYAVTSVRDNGRYLEPAGY